MSDAAPPVSAPVDLARSTAAMTVLTAVSRATGFIRILVVAAVLGDTFLGNTYESANTVPNLLFEIFAAGVLQAVLIPTLVELFDQGDDDRAAHVARSVLGLAGALLAGLAVIGMAASPFVMRLLVSGAPTAKVRADEVRLGTVFLLLFLPQVLMYAGGMVATAVLNARHKFAVPVVAPTINNIVVTAAYGLFWILRDGKAPSLHLSVAEVLVLGGGTTFGVVAFTIVPIIGAARSGVSLRPSFDRHDEHVRRIARRGGWAAAFLACTQVLMAVILLLANRARGGVVQYTVAEAIFLLPHALFSLPVLTALFPMMSRHHASGDDDAYGRVVASGLRAIAFFALASGAALVALAVPVAHTVRFAEFSADGAAHVAAGLRAFAPGVLGYGTFLFLARACYATGDTRTPALVNLGAVVGGAGAMVVAVSVAGDAHVVAAIAGAVSGIYLVGSGALLFVLARRHPGVLTGVARGAIAALGAAVVAGGAMWLVHQGISGTTRTASAAAILVGGSLGVVVYVGIGAVLGGPRPSTLPALLRGQG